MECKTTTPCHFRRRLKSALILVVRFRWVACQLDSLKTCLNRPSLQKALTSLPKTLDDTYARILCNIHDDHQGYVLKILQWLVYSIRPMKLVEIAEIIIVDVNENPRFDAERRFPQPRDIIMICSGLVTTATTTATATENSSSANTSIGVKLAHFSVKEYLVSNRIQHGPAKKYSIQELYANARIAETCLAYLLHFDKSDSLTSQGLDEFPLAQYAAKHWTYHARISETETSMYPLLSMALFLDKKHAFLNWGCLYDVEGWSPDIKRDLETLCPPLYYTSLEGLLKSVKLLLEKGADVNAQGGYFGNALQAASYIGSKEVVRLLLAKGADVNAQGGNYGNALTTATYVPDNDEVIHSLLECGADVNAPRRKGSSDPLQVVSTDGNEKVVQL